MSSFILLPNDSLTTTTSSFIWFYCYLHRTALRAIKLRKLPTYEGGGSARLRRRLFCSLSPTVSMNTYKNIYSISIYLLQYQQRSPANSSQASIIFSKFRFDSGPPAAGSLRSDRQREWAGVTPALIERSHGLCVLGFAHVRVCVHVSWPCDHQAGQRPRVLVSFLLSFLLSRSHFCIRATTS